MRLLCCPECRSRILRVTVPREFRQRRLSVGLRWRMRTATGSSLPPTARSATYYVILQAWWVPRWRFRALLLGRIIFGVFGRATAMVRSEERRVGGERRWRGPLCRPQRRCRIRREGVGRGVARRRLSVV